MTVSSGIGANAFAMAGYRALQPLSLCDRSWNLPPVFDGQSAVTVVFQFFCGFGRYVALISKTRLAL